MEDIEKKIVETKALLYDLLAQKEMVEKEFQAQTLKLKELFQQLPQEKAEK